MAKTLLLSLAALSCWLWSAAAVPLTSQGEIHDTSPQCDHVLVGLRAKVSGNFAVLEASDLGTPQSSASFKSQIQKLYDCHWLGHSGGDDLGATVTSDAEAAMLSLSAFADKYRILMVHVAPWPGNLAKLPAYADLLRALAEESKARRAIQMAVRPSRILLTDCCDVLFRRDSTCFGGGSEREDVFARFSKVFGQRGEQVVFSAERGTSMLLSRDEYVWKQQQATTHHAAKSPPQGWLVPINRSIHDGSSKASQRHRHFSHKPGELPPSPLLFDSTPDVCTGMDGICLHPKSVNTGLVMGELDALADVYERTLHLCGEHCSLDQNQSSDQNPVGHYLLASKFCKGKCVLDYNFTLFHTMQGRAGIYGLLGTEKNGTRLPKDVQKCNATCGKPIPGERQLFLLIPVAKRLARRPTSKDVIATLEWIALSSEVYSEAWFPVPACALHAAGLPEPHQAHNLNMLREGLGVPLKPLDHAVEVRRVAIETDGWPRPVPGKFAEVQPYPGRAGLMRHE